MNVQVELPEKKRKRTKKTKNSYPSSSPPPSFSLLPDEILVSCLARVSSSYYPTLSIVSKSFRSILSSAELKAARSHLGNTEQWLYVCLYDISFHTHQWFRLLLNPNGTLPDSVIMKNKTIEQLLVPVTFSSSSNLPSVSKSTIAVGSEIYVIGGPVDYAPSSAVRVLDCCTHTWRNAPSMNIVRMNALASLHDGKIYVTGGCLGVKSCDEVFDIKAQTWERLPDPSGSELSYCDINFGWTNVKGLDSLREKYDWNGSTTKLVSCGGKLLLVWQGCGNSSPDNKKILGTEIVLEKCVGGELWGKAGWLDVLYTVPRLRQKLLHCLAVSV
ncbi:PREDICTED: F-box/kelch-repeat protein At4g19865-like [Camelina sativa]|uniref:F-box/kelch-repeat protein At4g19865-like n=1 Tax=Camelina sativa TaxID=90675 RepID=A0ABM0U660_CAMSA|nr:PREDICTED: F-box/kelch-repeat protein At4g19865-like [Camelina sativa]